jgi:TolA-binding protein
MARTLGWRAWKAAGLASVMAASIAAGAREARLTAKVVSEAGAPIPEAAITITTPSMRHYRVRLKTDAGGSFAAVLIDADWRYTIRAEKAGYAPTVTQVKVPAGATQELSLTLYPPVGAAPRPSAGGPASLFKSGMSAYQSGDYRTAGSFFVRATQIKRDLADAYFWLAMCEYKLDRLRESRATFQRYLALAPNGDQAKAARRMIASIPNR